MCIRDSFQCFQLPLCQIQAAVSPLLCQQLGVGALLDHTAIAHCIDEMCIRDSLCAVDPATGIQYRNIAPGQDGFIWGSNSIGQDLWARIWAGARTSLTIAFFVALIEAVVGITAGVLWGYVLSLM